MFKVIRIPLCLFTALIGYVLVLISKEEPLLLCRFSPYPTLKIRNYTLILDGIQYIVLCLFQVYSLVIRHLYTLQRDRPTRSSNHVAMQTSHYYCLYFPSPLSPISLFPCPSGNHPCGICLWWVCFILFCLFCFLDST